MIKEEIIPTSFRNLFMYIEEAKIFIEEGNVFFQKISEQTISYYNIPYLNLSILMLGPGISITSAALNKLGESKVTVISVTNNFRGHSITLSMDSGENTKYFHKFIDNLYKKDLRIEIAKNLLKERELFTNKFFPKILIEDYNNEKFGKKILERLPSFSNEFLEKESIESLMGVEGFYMKKMREAVKIEFEYLNLNESDLRKRYDIGNSLIYGMSSTVLHSLGIPYQLNIFHGRTNAGALKYDIADIIKTIVYLTSHLSLNKDSEFWYSSKEKEYVKKLGIYLSENKLLKFLFVKTIESLKLN